MVSTRSGTPNAYCTDTCVLPSGPMPEISFSSRQVVSRLVMRFAVQQTNAPQLLIVSQDAAQTLSTLAAAGANIELLRETTKLS